MPGPGRKYSVRNSMCPCGSGLKFKKCCGGVISPISDLPEDLRSSLDNLVSESGDISVPTNIQEMILADMRKIGAPPDVIHAFKKLGYIIPDGDRDKFPVDALKQWDDTITEFRKGTDES